MAASQQNVPGSLQNTASSPRNPTGSHQGMTGSHQGVTGSQQGLTGSHQGLTGSHQGVTGSQQGMTGSPRNLTGSHQGMAGSPRDTATSPHTTASSPRGSMPEAQSAVDDFMHKAGQHDTTVHERIAGGITHENVQRTQHENVTTAVDKEIHQHHYHTSVQPVTDKEVLPEDHKHNLVAVEHRSHEHGDPKDVETRLANEAAKFKDERVVGDTHHTHSVAPVVAGEHIHHHVHETIQPVVQKQTIQPSVVHTTVPIHETHHNAAQHHSTSALPAVTMDEFQKQGGALSGRAERQDAFEGEPRSVGGALSGDGYTTKPRSSLGDKVNPRKDADLDGKRGVFD